MLQRAVPIAAFLLLSSLSLRAADLPLPSDDELEKSGAVIGDVDIRVQDIFDPEDPREDHRILANVVHIDLAFPLDGDGSIKSMQWLVRTKASF